MRAKIIEVIPKSIADELGIVPEEYLVAINDQSLMDIIDYEFVCTDDFLVLEICDLCGESYFCDVEKEPDEPLGLVFESNLFDGMHSCHNNCLFCFMAQLPQDSRKSLIVRDDDYRMSFLQGNYITGTNLTNDDIDRIVRLKLSPLYFSVHSSDGELRKKLLRNKKADELMPLLRKLTQNGIEVHGQVVLCPDLNDQENLLQTIEDVEALGENMLSLAVVPVGLTAFQKNDCMRLLTSDESLEVISMVEKKQAEFLDKRGSSFVFLADEFYLLADYELPPNGHYEGYPQLENGIGLCRQLLTEWASLRSGLPQVVDPQKFLLLTGKSSEKILKPIVEELTTISGLQVEVMAVENKYFGSSITVSGLVTGCCIKEALQGKKDLPTLILPSVMLKYKEDVFLDDCTLDELQADLGCEIVVVEPTAFGLLAALNLINE